MGGRSKLLNPTDETTLEDDVHYGIADCRRRLRSQRSSLRAQDIPPKHGSSGYAAGRVGSFAEVLANVSMSQSSLSKLVECLLEPIDSTASQEEKEEAVIT